MGEEISGPNTAHPSFVENLEPVEPPPQVGLRPVLLAVLLTSLAWIVIGGLLLLRWRQPQSRAFEIQPPPATSTPQPSPTPAPLLVEVDGAVEHPGLYELPPGSRIEQALAAAGGLTRQADPRSLNLAQSLQDGMKIYAPAQGETPPPAPAPSGSAAGQTDSAVETTFPLNINQASEAELQTLPGIGPVTAQAIIAHREANGPFDSVERIVDVKGIGAGTLEKIRALITVQ